MERKKSGYIDVDKLIEHVDPETVLRFYGIQGIEAVQSGTELRMQCVLNCGKECETGNRAISMRTDDPAKRWKCHQYECGKSGNLVGFVDLLKDGPHMNGRPRGKRFKEIAAELQAIANGEVAAPLEKPQSPPPSSQSGEPSVNISLVRSEKESARALVALDEQFLVEPDAAMNKHAASYIRKRPYMTPEILRKWRCGFLPHSAKGLLRGKFVYPMLSERGEVLTWFGRDCEYEQKKARWEAGGRDPKREPRKFQYVKGFHRGLELFGQHASRLEEPGIRDAIRELGVLVVEGPNDVIALDALGVPSVGLCSNQITGAQVAKIKRWADTLADGQVTLMLDCDPEGENGAKQALFELAQHTHARLAWSLRMFDGRFQGRQPESLTAEEWQEIRDRLSLHQSRYQKIRSFHD